MVKTVRPKAKATPTKPIPNSGKAAAMSADPQPPKTSQNVPRNSAIERRISVGDTDDPPLHTPKPASSESPKRYHGITYRSEGISPEISWATENRPLSHVCLRKYVSYCSVTLPLPLPRLFPRWS